MTLYLWNVVVYSLQLAALVAAAYAITAALRLRSPRLSLGFWQIVMGIAIVLPLAQPRTEGGAVAFVSSTANGLSTAPGGTAIAPAGIDGITIAVLVIAAGIALRLLWLAAGLLRLRSMVAHAHGDDAITRVIADLHPSLGANATVMISDDVEGPATIGVRRPIILLPRSVVQMSEAVQRAILCHELVQTGWRQSATKSGARCSGSIPPLA